MFLHAYSLCSQRVPLLSPVLTVRFTGVELLLALLVGKNTNGQMFA